jgi:hypothetical protein
VQPVSLFRLLCVFRIFARSRGRARRWLDLGDRRFALESLKWQNNGSSPFGRQRGVGCRFLFLPFCLAALRGIVAYHQSETRGNYEKWVFTEYSVLGDACPIATPKRSTLDVRQRQVEGELKTGKWERAQSTRQDKI